MRSLVPWVTVLPDWELPPRLGLPAPRPWWSRFVGWDQAPVSIRSPLATWCRMTKALFSHQNAGESREFIFCLQREEFLAPLWLSGASLWALHQPTASGAHMTPRAELLGRWDLSPPWSHSGLSLLGLLVTGSQPQSECGLGHTQGSRRPTSRCVLCSVAGSVGDSHPTPALWSSLDMSGGVPSGASLNSPPAFSKARVSPRPPAQLPPLSGPISRVSSECGWRGSLPRGTSGVPADPRQSRAA